MIHLDPTSRTPIYQQIEEQIAELIVMGVFPPESRLPSVRSMAAETGLNPNTIQKAYQELESFVGGRENAAAVSRERAEEALQEALRQARLAGVEKNTAAALLQQCYGGEEIC